MNIKILDSWLREYLKTKASASKIAEVLSLTSASVEKLEKIDKDYLYDIEVTTNRPDLMSVIGLAREAAAALPQFSIETKFIPAKLEKPKDIPKENLPIEIQNDPELVNRICAVIMGIDLKQSSPDVKKRLEAAGIRSLNNVIDVTNYVMREIGHPTHVFDYDKLITKKIIIRKSKKGEKIKTLDGKGYILGGEDIVADNGKGEVLDLIGIMGLENSVITNQTKRILFFINNNKPNLIRKTSMSLGIRTEAAILNEKEIDPQLAMNALLRGIELYKKIADGEIASKIIDIYPNKPKTKQVIISQEKINSVIGVKIPLKTSLTILKRLGFEVDAKGNLITLTVPYWRNGDIKIEEDIIEEIARIYGYHKLPDIIPPSTGVEAYHQSEDPFYWEKRVKNALKYWGFTEAYTYSFVSEELYEGPVEEAVGIQNPLTEEFVYMRRTLVPSLLKVVSDNKTHEEIKIFEISNIYRKKTGNLPDEILTLGGVIKKTGISFFEVKGLLEQLFSDLGIQNAKYKKRNSGEGAEIYIEEEYAGDIEILESNLINFEINFEIIKKHGTLKKIYRSIPKYPPIIEDLAFVADLNISTEKIINEIEKQNAIIKKVFLYDRYKNLRTFRIIYQHPQRNLTNEEVTPIRNRIIKTLEEKFKAKLKQ